MKLEVGQIIQHVSKFYNQPEEELDRHIILSVDGEWLEVHCLFTRWPEGTHRPGEASRILISYMDSEEDTTNNIYWRIMS